MQIGDLVWQKIMVMDRDPFQVREGSRPVRVMQILDDGIVIQPHEGKPMVVQRSDLSTFNYGGRHRLMGEV